MTSQGQTFFEEVCPLRTLISKNFEKGNFKWKSLYTNHYPDLNIILANESPDIIWKPVKRRLMSLPPFHRFLGTVHPIKIKHMPCLFWPNLSRYTRITDYLRRYCCHSLYQAWHWFLKKAQIHLLNSSFQGKHPDLEIFIYILQLFAKIWQCKKVWVVFKIMNR